MSWLDIEGHDRVADRFRAILASGRLASSYLFVGPAGCGKRTFALRLAECLLCESTSADPLAACGQCEACQQVRAGTHPDLIFIARPEDKQVIPVDLLIGDDEHRGREGLCHDLSLKPFRADRRVAILDDADDLNEEGANCLLKTLEEPPPHSLLILIGTSAEKQLPTIRSRCQIVHFRPLGVDIAARLLVEQGVVEDLERARLLARIAGGSLTQAARLADEELWKFRGELMRGLAELPRRSFALARAVTACVEAAGKEAPRRRARAVILIGFAVDYYYALLHRLVAAEATDPAGVEVDAGDADLDAAVTRAVSAAAGEVDGVAEAIDRCLAAEAHVGRNANLATLVDSWIADLADLQARMVAC
ncbi:MAG: DNA polymerase III subunit delta' [Planctomycetota bacterium]|nr:MAG: DNA polymerase III subunit delta' [Planctomycetota bacterium]REK23733.1 MAG: DNA polymerase III subunit delta' [Planctomycetota bacterium]REK47586.1 MAG: DNA polymerase III subunit delta' [Planctomycetota bacterium]